MIIGKDELLFEKIDDEIMMYIPTRKILAKISLDTYKKIRSRSLDIENIVREYKYCDIEKVNTKESNCFPRLSINISDDCQLRCDYCYLAAGEQKIINLMSFEMGKDIFDSYMNFLYNEYTKDILKKQNIWISFFGGAEPTFNKKVFLKLVDYILDYAKREELNIKLSITTNGYFDKEVCVFISQKFSNILISLDGPEEIQNMHRKTSSGKGSFEQILENAKYLYQNNNVNFRVTISRKTYKKLDKILDFYKYNFPKSNIIVGKVADIGRASVNRISCGNDINDYIYEMIIKYKDCLHFSMIEKKDVDNIKTCYCGAVTGRHYIVSSDNTIKCCSHLDEEEYFKIGKIEDGCFRLDKEKITYLKERFDVRNNIKCKECIAKYYCGGGCPSNEIYSKEISCDITKKIFIYKMLNKF